MFPFFNLFMLPLTANTYFPIQQPPYSFQQTYQLTEEEMRGKRAEAARSFEDKKINGDFTYLQEQLCATYPQFENESYIPNNNFSSILSTPFGTSTINFRWCQAQNRHNRFVVCSRDSNYCAITKKLDETYTDKQDRINIWHEIFNYLTLPPVKGADPWKYLNPNHLSKYQDKNLANLCAILAVCDPCFGENENGGKDVRVIFNQGLSSSERDFDFSFKNFANVEFNPAAAKGAYKLYRISTNSKSFMRLKNPNKKITIELILINITPKHTPIKSPQQSKLEKDKKPKPCVSPKKVNLKKNGDISCLSGGQYVPLDFNNI